MEVKYKNYKSIYRKIVIYYSIFTLVLVLIVNFSKFIIDSYLVESYLEKVSYKMDHYSEQLETRLLEMTSVHVYLQNNVNTAELSYNYDNLSEYNKVSCIKNLSNDLKLLTLSNNYIFDVGIYIPAMNKVVTANGGVREYANVYVKSGKVINEDYHLFNIDQELYMVKRAGVIDGVSKDILSYILIDKEAISGILDEMSLTEECQVGIVYNDRHVLASTDKFMIPNKKEQEKDSNVVEDVYISKTYDKSTYILETNEIFKSIKIILYFGNGDITYPIISSINVIFTFIIVVSLIFMIGFVIMIKLTLQNPINIMTQALREVEKGNLDVEIEYTQQDEFQYFFNVFNDMIISLKENIQQNYEKELELRKSELKQLQSQINPHFLYNCFFNISNMCRIEDVDNAMKLSQKLAGYYMYITRNSRDEVTLGEEYKHAKNYLDIQKLRFGERVSITIDELPDALKNIMVPRIIIQPLLENAYKYTFEKIPEQGKLEVRVTHTNSILNISISDNGQLVDDDIFEKINKKLRESNKRIEKTGLINVSRRLAIKYNNNGFLNVSRSHLGGMKVEIVINLGGNSYV